MKQSVIDTIQELAPALAALFDKIRDESRDGEGVTRDAFGARETRAGEIVADFARREKLETGFDHGGNLHITAPGRWNEACEIAIGSHLDSVPIGGNYDGLAGVIAGLAVLIALQRDNRSVRVFGFRGEESPWFSEAYLGSKLLLGLLTHEQLWALRRFDTGRSLAEHLGELGINLPRDNLAPTIPLHKLKAYFELHIEQAPLLESLARPLGIATAIRGNIRHPFARCFGQYAHSGAMPRAFRRDALIATAKLIAFADERWDQLIEAGNDDLVFTCGMFQTDSSEHAMTKVPGQVTFTLNIGGTNNDMMEYFQGSLASRAKELEREHGVEFDFGRRVGTPAVDLDSSLLAAVERAGDDVGVAPLRMPTVGHDAAMFQRNGIPAAVLLVRNANGSHNPKEHMEMSDFITGTMVLASTVYDLCR